MEVMKNIRDSPSLPIFIASPEEGTGPYPVVLLFMHRPGLDEPMKIVCRDLAKEGYLAVGFDEYHDGAMQAEDLTDESVFKDFEATLEFVKTINNANTSSVGIVGFCAGGRHVYLTTVKYPNVKATVSYYGFPCRGPSEESTPINLISEYKSPVLGIFGKQDHLFDFADVEKFSEKLLASSPDHKVAVYDDVGHGFLNPLSPKHGKESAEKAWKETISHFDKNLK
ncbi:MAG: dienelactone hydrolase family protein [Candidatus Hodarchaeales archaeon]|jgi:carboxymethylenebutenolidase